MADSGERSGSAGRANTARTSRNRLPASAAASESPRQTADGLVEAGGYRGVTPPQFPAPGRHPWTYVEHPEQLRMVVAALAASDVLALDAEFVQVRVRGPDDPPHRLALLQIAMLQGPTGAYVIDALRFSDLTALREPLEDARSLKLFHGIGADTRVLRTRDLEARHTLDLEAVSRSIFGQRESGLQTMLLRACGVRLDKSLQRSDWTRRPLTPAMLGYAARDAEMTLVLYTWLKAHFPWAVELHVVPAADPTPDIATWIVPFLNGPRPQLADWAVAAAGLENQREQQSRDLRAALAVVRRPTQRARVLRLIGDLELNALEADLVPVLQSPASDERASAARALGRLRARDAEAALRALQDDPTEDVRDAARAALESLSAPPPATARFGRGRPGQANGWTSGASESDAPPAGAWQEMLRAHFQQQTSQQDDAPAPDTTSPADTK